MIFLKCFVDAVNYIGYGVVFIFIADRNKQASKQVREMIIFLAAVRKGVSKYIRSPRLNLLN